MIDIIKYYDLMSDEFMSNQKFTFKIGFLQISNINFSDLEESTLMIYKKGNKLIKQENIKQSVFISFSDE